MKKKALKYTLSRVIILIGILTIGYHFASAQAPASFNGNWTINKIKTDFGQAPETVLPKSFKVEQVGSKIAITRSTLNATGQESLYTESFSADEATSKIVTPSGSKRIASIKWTTDHSGFALTSTAVSSNGDPGLKTAEQWSLANNGKALIVDRSVTQPDGLKYEIKAYYDRN